MTAGFRTSGGEGGIRTLGTGVSPYNGLASVTIYAVLQSCQRLTVGPEARNWVQRASYGNFCSPLCSPMREGAYSQAAFFVDARASISFP